jgi:hypothetical protein
MTKRTLPAELRPEDITAIIDTKEQLPLDLFLQLRDAESYGRCK